MTGFNVVVRGETFLKSMAGETSFLTAVVCTIDDAEKGFGIGLVDEDQELVLADVQFMPIEKKRTWRAMRLLERLPRVDEETIRACQEAFSANTEMAQSALDRLQDQFTSRKTLELTVEMIKRDKPPNRVRKAMEKGIRALGIY